MNRDDKVTNPVGSPPHDYGGNVSAATLSVWAGEHESLVQGATQVPVVYSAAYGYPDVDTWLDVALGRKPGHIYSRNTNLTVQVFEEKVRLLEGAEAATSFATGMAAIVVADNTFATPINQKPLALGADLVVHSATKFLGGHADALGGVVCGNARLVQQIYHSREIAGATLDPMAAYLIICGTKTLHLRVRQQNESALRIARWLYAHPAVAKVFYPGLETHVHHKVASRQMSGYGGVLSFMLQRGLRSGQARPAATAIRAPCRQPRRCRNHCWASRNDESRGVYARRTRSNGNSRGAHPLFSRYRGSERPDKRPVAGARGGLNSLA